MNKKLDIVRPELYPVPVKSPWYHIGMDFIGPIYPTSSSRNRFILTISGANNRSGQGVLEIFLVVFPKQVP